MLNRTKNKTRLTQKKQNTQVMQQTKKKKIEESDKIT